MNEWGSGEFGTFTGDWCNGVWADKGQSSLHEQWLFWGGACGLGVAQTFNR